MATERLAKSLHIRGKLAPIPRHISAGCGIAFQTDLEYHEIFKNALRDADIEYDDFHIVEAL